MAMKAGSNSGSTKRANERTSPALSVAKRNRPKPAAPNLAAAKPSGANPPKKNPPGAQPANAKTAPAAGTSRRPDSSGSMLAIAIIGALAVSLVVALPTVPIVLLGMIPTAVAAFVERGPHKTAAICVAGLNFAGVAPFVAVLWKGPNTLYHSIAILSDAYSWLAMYGAASLGWLLCLALPPIAASILKIVSAQQIAGLHAQQAKLREEWGIGSARKNP